MAPSESYTNVLKSVNLEQPNHFEENLLECAQIVEREPTLKEIEEGHVSNMFEITAYQTERHSSNQKAAVAHRLGTLTVNRDEFFQIKELMQCFT